ncbi:MAG TPA: hypothetical protein PKI05_04465 [Thermogutta sp.]|nr:hypothetical protein [Thermogutta sp.]
MTNRVWPKMMSFCALGLTSGISVRWSVLKAVILVGYISVGVFVFLLSGQGLAATVEEGQKPWKPGPRRARHRPAGSGARTHPLQAGPGGQTAPPTTT